MAPPLVVGAVGSFLLSTFFRVCFGLVAGTVATVASAPLLVSGRVRRTLVDLSPTPSLGATVLLGVPPLAVPFPFLLEALDPTRGSLVPVDLLHGIGLVCFVVGSVGLVALVGLRAHVVSRGGHRVDPVGVLLIAGGGVWYSLVAVAALVT